MSGNPRRDRGPRQVVHRTTVQDVSGLARLPYTRGFGRFLAYTGLFVMLGGLAVFGFFLVSMISQSFGTGDRPALPTMMPIGFGVGIIGAIMLTIGLAIG